MKAADLCLGLSPAISAVGSMRRALPPPVPVLDPLLVWHLPGHNRDPHISTHPPAQLPVSVQSNPASRLRKVGGDPMLLNTPDVTQGPSPLRGLKGHRLEKCGDSILPFLNTDLFAPSFS